MNKYLPAVFVRDNRSFPLYHYPDDAEIEVWGVVTFNIHSHRGHQSKVYVHRQMTIDLPGPVNDTIALIRAATKCVDRHWQPDLRYMKGGIISTDLSDMACAQGVLFDAMDQERSEPLMKAMDRINARYGRFCVAPAAVGVQAEWRTKFEKRTPRYTTRFSEMPSVRS